MDGSASTKKNLGTSLSPSLQKTYAMGPEPLNEIFLSELFSVGSVMRVSRD